MAKFRHKKTANNVAVSSEYLPVSGLLGLSCPRRYAAIVATLRCSPDIAGAMQNSFSWLAQQVDYMDVGHNFVLDGPALQEFVTWG